MDNTNQVQGVKGLKKRSLKISSIVFMLYCLTAAGCFGVEEMVSGAGPGLTIILLIVFPIVWAYPICSICSECVAILPHEGGYYVWVKEAFGEFWGFQCGWWGTVSCYITNGVYVSLVADYTSQVIALTPASTWVIKIGMIVIFTIINIMGIEEVSKVSTFFSLSIILAFSLVAIVGLMNWQTNPMEPIMPADYTIVDGLGQGICLAVWMYCGYESITTMAGEIQDPKVIPKGLKIVMPLIALTYLLPTVASIACMPEGSWADWSTGITVNGSSMGFSTVLITYLGHGWGYVFLLVAIFSQCSMFNSYLASGSRGFFVMADDNHFPKFFVKVGKKRGTPYIAILSLSAVTLVLCSAEFTTLVMAEVVFMLAYYILMACSVIKLRKKYPIEERKAKGLYVMPGGKLGLIYFAVMPIIVAVIAFLVNGTDYLFLGLLATATGPVFYVVFKRIYGGMHEIDPANYPLNRKTKLAFGDMARIGLYMVITGALAFLGQFWLKWYEVDYGSWGPEDYDAFGSVIPQVLQILKWGGLVLAIAGIVCIIACKKIETEENKR